MNELKKNKKILIIVVLCVLIFASLVIWRTFFHISSDYRLAAERAVEFADEILDGNRSAFDSLIYNRKDFDAIFENIPNPISRHERELARLFMHFTSRLSDVSSAENAYFSVTVLRGADPNDPEQYHLFVKSEEDRIRDEKFLQESRNTLLDVRNQLAEMIGIEHRETFETLGNWEELARTALEKWRAERSTGWVPGEPNSYGTNESWSDFNLD